MLQEKSLFFQWNGVIKPPVFTDPGVDLFEFFRFCAQRKENFRDCLALIQGKAVEILEDMGGIIKKPERINPAADSRLML